MSVARATHRREADLGRASYRGGCIRAWGAYACGQDSLEFTLVDDSEGRVGLSRLTLVRDAGDSRRTVPATGTDLSFGREPTQAGPLTRWTRYTSRACRQILAAVDNDGKLRSGGATGLADHEYIKQDIYTFTQEVYLKQRVELLDMKAERQVTPCPTDRTRRPQGLPPGCSYPGCRK